MALAIILGCVGLGGLYLLAWLADLHRCWSMHEGTRCGLARGHAGQHERRNRIEAPTRW